jgi:predicted nucleic acid-binding Zn ribbon protein
MEIKISDIVEAVGAQKCAPKPTEVKMFPKGKYACPKCDNIVEVFVRMSQEPACCKHTTGQIPMKKVGRK